MLLYQVLLETAASDITKIIHGFVWQTNFPNLTFTKVF